MKKKIILLSIVAIIVFASFVSAGLPSAICYPLSTGILCLNSSFSAPNSYLAQSPALYLSGNTFIYNETWANSNFANATIFNALSNRESVNNNTQASLINLKHDFANCPADQIVQNTTLTGVQCVPYISSSGSSYNQSLNTSDNVRFNNVTAQNFIGLLNWSWLLNIPSYVKDWTSEIASVNKTNEINAINSSLQNEIILQSSNNASQALLISNLETKENANNITQNNLINLKLNLTDQRYNETNLLIAINSSLQSEISLQNANNATQANLINTKASLTTNNNFLANNTFNGETYFLGNINLYNNTQNSYNMTFLLKDNSNIIQGNWSINTLTSLADFYTSGKIYEAGIWINNKYNDSSLINSINSSLQSEISLQNANNITQANLISVLRIDNSTQSILINNLQTDNTTQANLINNRLQLIGGIMTGNITLSTNQSNIILSGSIPRYIWYFNATIWDCLNATGTIYNRGNASITCN